jgi:lipopolysaccharide/colanic/teichoic acid biosynthesis glycosyltransferase
LPQLWNVVKGEMSLVGPRAFPDYHLQAFDSEFRALRRKVKPGITGYWQVQVRSNGGLEVQQKLDSHYIHNWSLWFDLYILGRTVTTVLKGHGAY